MTKEKISLSQARLIALAAQGFDRPRPQGPADIRHIRRVMRQLGLLQLDFVNVLIPAHFLVLYSRLGTYDQKRLGEIVYKRREFTEQWAHEASIVPMETWPLLEHRRQEFKPWPNSPIMKISGKAKYLKQIMEQIQAGGAVTSKDLPPIPAPKRKAGDWHRSVPRWALEYHFGFGKLAVKERLSNFQRVYDLPERLIDAEHLNQTISRAHAQKELLLLAANSYGIATMRDLADYYRMSPHDAAPAVAQLVDEGAINEVEVEGWKDPAYLAPNARIPRKLSCSSLLSPFDPVVWFRPRAERLFNFHYRIEIYVPEKKRKWGYYVLPFLLDDRIVARVDLKADRKLKQLLVLATHKEDGIDEQKTIEHLAQELKSLAAWLGLERVKVSRRGPFARNLAAHMKP
jgi:uncharacterized protein YcaQ